MDSMFTVSCPTELRNIRQILAEITRTREALEEASIAVRKQKIEIAKKRMDYANAQGLDRDIAEIEIEEIESKLKNTHGYILGAIRKLSAYTRQYKAILQYIGKDEFTEADFEEDEERYHIMKAFEQGLCAARSRGGVIDEGNQIYFYQIGINGMVAQAEVTRYIQEEMKLLEAGKEPAHEMTVKFLAYCARKFKGCAAKYAERKGMSLIDYESLRMHDVI